ncbi:beta-galactosidase [Streptomyces sp. NPDC054887]
MGRPPPAARRSRTRPVNTYVPWNFHERHRDDNHFDGWRDLPEFLRLAQEPGLDAIVWPGPYICAEWDNGGLPAWLTGRHGVRPKRGHRDCINEVSRRFDVLIPIIATRQTAHGGRVAVQIENEYGSYGDDRVYMGWWRDSLAHAESRVHSCACRSRSSGRRTAGTCRRRLCVSDVAGRRRG